MKPGPSVSFPNGLIRPSYWKGLSSSQLLVADYLHHTSAGWDYWIYFCTESTGWPFKTCFSRPVNNQDPPFDKVISILLFVASHPIMYCIRVEADMVTPIIATSGEKKKSSLN
jgi:hypothetical protein